MLVELHKINLTTVTGHEVGEVTGTIEQELSKAKAYFNRIRQKNKKPTSTILIPASNSGYGLDSLGQLVKGAGTHEYNKYGKLVQKIKEKEAKAK